MSKKSKAIEFAVEHFSSKGVRKIEVPEWKDADGNALEIFVSPMTLAEKRRLYKGTKADDIGVLADVLIMKSKDSEGNKLFSLEDKETLMFKVDPDVLSRVAEEIMVAPNVEDFEKN
jgi:hypothetical protein